MPSPLHGLSDAQLVEWADEHLVYEGRMLAYALAGLAERPGARDQRANSFLECFAVHGRCLRDFLWNDRRTDKKRFKKYDKDAVATDFCEPGKWEAVRGDMPPGLDKIDERSRCGREVQHLTYHRLGISKADKIWDCRTPYDEIQAALIKLAGIGLRHG